VNEAFAPVVLCRLADTAVDRIAQTAAAMLLRSSWNRSSIGTASDGADCAGVIVGEHALAVEGGGDRDVEGLGEAGHSGLSGGPGRAVPGEQDRAVRGPQQVCRAADLGR
jgi:hypothetical protein